MTRVRLAALIAASTIASALSTYETVQVRRVNGRFTAFIRLQSERLSALRQVSWDTNFRQTDVQTAVSRYSAGEVYGGFPHDSVRLPADGVIEIKGRAGGTESPFRILRNDWVYERFVVLKLEYEDGVILYRWAEVEPNSTTVIAVPADASR